MLQDSDLDARCAQVRTIARSEDFIAVIILAVVLSYYATGLQKNQLCGDVAQDDNVALIRFAAAILVLLATTYFYRLSVQSLCTPQNNCTARVSARYNHLSSLLVLIAAIVRLMQNVFSATQV